MKLYPLFADLSHRAVLVVGGGPVAERKVAALMGARAQVTVNAPELTPQLQRWVAAGLVAHRRTSFRESWLDRVWLVVAATPDGELNRLIATFAGLRRIFVNVVDDAALSSFHVPAVIDRAPLTIAISSGGEAPMLARLLRERLETLVDHSWGALTTLVASMRKRIVARFPAMGARRRFYETLLAGQVTSLLRQAQPEAARLAAEAALQAATAASVGSVVLVGAGPGDPGLLTLRALRALNEADVILYDRLVSAEVLGLARRDAQRTEVGKQAGHHHTTQDRIHALLLEHARAGRRVVRLKGGDPFVFGRGGEELEFLREHGIDYEVVPGITAAVACAAYAGVPLTHRQYAHSVRFLTAHHHSASDQPDWAALAQDKQTLAIYMCVAELGALQTSLVAHGRSLATPFALIENGSRPEQRVVTGTLANLLERSASHAVRSPALLIVGEVAALASSLAWFGQPPLGAAVHTLHLPDRASSQPHDVLMAVHRG